MGGRNTPVGYYIEQLYPERKLPIEQLMYTNEHINAERYIEYVSTIYLYTLIYSDYREYLNLSRIITAHQRDKLALLNQKAPIPNSFSFLKNDINDLNTILFKDELNDLILISLENFNLTREAANKIWEWTAGIIIVGLYQQMKQSKLNLSGLIVSISQSQSKLKSTLSYNTIKQIQYISTDNRKRSKTYTRGGKEQIDNKSVYYVLSIIGFIAIAYVLFSILRK